MPKYPEEQMRNYAHNSGRRQVARRESQMISGGRQRLNWMRKARQTNQQPSRCYN